MIITSQPANQRLILDLTNDEWAVVKHLNKVFGSVFLKTFLEDFLAKRLVQKNSVRGDRLVSSFTTASPAVQSQILTALALDFQDE
jgi:hypothetical protein